MHQTIPQSALPAGLSIGGNFLLQLYSTAGIAVGEVHFRTLLFASNSFMNDIYIRRETGDTPPVHILIVCVGWYGQRPDSGEPTASNIAPLPGAEETARRLVEFWEQGEGEGRLLGMAVGSIRVLVSAKNGFEIGGHSPPPATAGNAVAAIRAWLKDCEASGACGIVHWIGHGITTHDESGNVLGPLAICEDSEMTDVNVISFRDLHNCMISGYIPNNCLLFIDTCCEFLEFGDDEITHHDVVEIKKSQPKPYCASPSLFSLSNPGQKTFLLKDANPSIQFKGGSLISEALIDALNYYAAAPNDNGVVALSDIASTVVERLTWWRGLLAGKPIPRLVRATLEMSEPEDETPFPVRSREPRVMLDVIVTKRGEGKMHAPVSLEGINGIGKVNTCSHGNGRAAQDFIQPITWVSQGGGEWRGETLPGGWCCFEAVAPSDDNKHSFKKLKRSMFPRPNERGRPDLESNERMWEI